MNNIENSYRNDTAFRTTVDQMRVLLSQYHLTPIELREAAVLASALHESENIRPLLIQSEGKGCMVPLPKEYYYAYEQFYKPPAMFGGAQSVDTATGSNLDSHAHVFENTPYKFKRCACGISDVYYDWSTSSAKYIIEYKNKNKDGKFIRSSNAAITMSKGTNLNTLKFKGRASAEKEATAQQVDMGSDYTYRVALEKR